MQTWRTGAAWSGLFLASLGLANTWPAPAHPTALMAEHQGVPQAVIAVDKEEPVILVDGRRERLRGNIPLSTERVSRYSDATATLAGVRVEGLQMINAASELDADKFSPGATVAGYVEFSATVTASRDLTDCYLALVAFDSAFLVEETHPPKAQIRVRQLPDLKAGQPTPVKFSSTPFLGRENMSGFALLFSGGREVRTNVAARAEPFFQRRERLIHRAAVRGWLEANPRGNRPLQPLLQIPPLLASTAGFPADATADLTVAADGTVLHVGLDRTFPSGAAETIERTLGAWQFLPRIQGGLPVLTHVMVPLRF